MKRHLLMLVPAAVLAVGTLAACGGSDTASSGTPATSATTAPATRTSAANTASATITIKNFGYTVSGTVSPGEKISVHNNDSEAHTVTADTGDKFDVTVAPSATATFTAPDTAGSYAFHCTYHAEMHGTLTVR